MKKFFKIKPAALFLAALIIVAAVMPAAAAGDPKPRSIVVNGVRLHRQGDGFYGYILKTAKPLKMMWAASDFAQGIGRVTPRWFTTPAGKFEVVRRVELLISRMGGIGVTLRFLPFLHGWYDNLAGIKNLEVLARQGYNCVIVYLPGKVDCVKIKAYLDRARDVGINVILPVRTELVKTQQYGNIRKFIRKFRSHPSLLGWYIYDEPYMAYKAHKTPTPRSLVAVRRIILSEDPGRPVFICFGQWRKRKEYTKIYANTHDVYMFDRYPCEYKEKEFHKHRFVFYSSLVQFARDFSLLHKKTGFVVVTQGYGMSQAGKSQFNKRDPTINEYRYLVYTNLIRCPLGIINWAYYRSNSNLREKVIFPVLREYKPLMPYLTAGEFLSSKAEISPKKLKYNIGTFGGDTCLIIVNESQKNSRGSIKLKSGFDGEIISKPDGQKFTVKGGGFSCDFKAHQVRIFRF